MGDVVHVWRQGVFEKTLYVPFSQIFCEPKTAVKKKKSLKKAQSRDHLLEKEEQVREYTRMDLQK